MPTNVFFCHIPKTGGLSIRDTILEADKARKYYDIVPIFSEWQYEKHTPAFFTGHAEYSITEILPRPLYVFTMLRHPVDRLISYWKHVIRDGRGVRPDFDYLFDIPPDEAVDTPFFKVQGMTMILGSNSIDKYQYLLDNVERGKPEQYINALARYCRDHSTPNIFRGSEPVPDAVMDQHLERAKQALTEINFGIFENFESSADVLLSPLNLKYTLHETNNAPPTQIDPFTESHKQTIANNQKWDLELYQFAVELFNERLNN